MQARWFSDTPPELRLQHSTKTRPCFEIGIGAADSNLVTAYLKHRTEGQLPFGSATRINNGRLNNGRLRRATADQPHGQMFQAADEA